MSQANKLREQRVMFTIGYSTRTAQKFLLALKSHGVRVLIDVRTVPKSRHRPEFNKDRLSKYLHKNGIRYVHMKELGGLRKPSKDSKNVGWINASFRGFADYMQTREFSSAIKKLQSIAVKKKVAIMCAEGNPFRCHRSLIADAMLVRGYKVYEITGINGASEHKLTGFAKVSGTRIKYP
jgi:uncharacterized protein (DUF488 family)